METDPLIQALTVEQVHRDVAKFKDLLASGDELDIHSFLSNHSYFFNNLLRLYGVSPLYSKIRLGSNFEVDFVWFDTGTIGPEWYLTEIESPKKKLFNKSGDPSAALTHAIRQVLDWQAWVAENLDYARKLLPYIAYPLGYIFLGRRSDLTEETRQRLRRLNYEYRISLVIRSLDRFVDGALSVINLIEARGWKWPLQMTALKHEDLSRGLPQSAREYMKRYFSNLAFARYPKRLLEQRDGRLGEIDD